MRPVNFYAVKSATFEIRRKVYFIANASSYWQGNLRPAFEMEISANLTFLIGQTSRFAASVENLRAIRRCDRRSLHACSVISQKTVVCGRRRKRISFSESRR